jgi:hypothetical protein
MIMEEARADRWKGAVEAGLVGSHPGVGGRLH